MKYLMQQGLSDVIARQKLVTALHICMTLSFSHVEIDFCHQHDICRDANIAIEKEIPVTQSNSTEVS